jgi:hypothetical protein
MNAKFLLERHISKSVLRESKCPRTETEKIYSLYANNVPKGLAKIGQKMQDLV